MNYGQMRDRVVQRLSEYSAGAAESSAQASFTDATIYERLNDVLHELYAACHEEDPSKFLTLVSMTYTADTERVQLPAAARYRPVVAVEWLDGSVYRPVAEGIRLQREQANELDPWGDDLHQPYRFMVESDQILVWPTPSSDTTLRIRYVPALTDITTSDSASSPTWLPVEHHPVVALGATLSFKRETDNVVALEREYAERRARLAVWAAASPNRGPRFVREVN